MLARGHLGPLQEESGPQIFILSPCATPGDLGQAPSPILASSEFEVHPGKTQGPLRPSPPASLR